MDAVLTLEPWGWQLSALALFVLAGILALRRDRDSRREYEGMPARTAIAIACIVTSAWSLTHAALGAVFVGDILEATSGLAWLWVSYRLLARDGRHRSLGPIRPLVASVALVGFLQFALIVVEYGHPDPAASQLVLRISDIFHVLFGMGALVLVHNLYAGSAPQVRTELAWPASALALLWLYDLNLYTIAYLGSGRPELLLSLRAFVPLAMVALLSLGLLRPQREQVFRPSRSFAFQSLSLLAIGMYFLVMVLAYQGLSFIGGDFARIAQTSLLILAAAAALLLLPSARTRAWLRVTVAKNLFQHRYDYREEWLRFTRTMGAAGRDAAPLTERVVQAIADIAESPSGLLLAPGDDGRFQLAANWKWQGVDVPAQPVSDACARFFEASQFILDLDDWRQGRNEAVPADAVPQWLLDDPKSWVIVPLLHHERLHGLVVLSRPLHARGLDWEDLDLLRVVGQQLASYLAEEASLDALGEARRFDEFNRRIAFVMHDIKNLASQLSLLARNAEKHADNPAFRADMLVTLRNSTAKLETLLSRLGRYGKQEVETLVPTDLAALVRDTIARHPASARIEAIAPVTLLACVNPEALEQALMHMLHNALEASEESALVLVEVRRMNFSAMVEVVDSGCGMSPEFIRQHLFKPFHSTKAGGFGIGAMEAREMVRAMGGQLHVESREGLGTRFILTFPLADSIGPRAGEPQIEQKVA